MGKENPPSSELWYHITFALKREIALVIILTNSVQYQKCDLEGKKEKQTKEIGNYLTQRCGNRS